MVASLTIHKGNVKAKGEDVLLTNMYFGEQKTAGGLIVSSDDGVERGIKPRWGQVFSIGPNYKHRNEIAIGDWVLLEHGRWSRGIHIEDNEGVEWIIRKADTDSILMVTSDEPSDVSEWVELHKEQTQYLKSKEEERNIASDAPAITIRKAPKQTQTKE